MPRAVADAFNRVAEDASDCFIERGLQVLTSGLILELLDGELSQPARNSCWRGAGLRGGGGAVQEAEMDLQLEMEGAIVGG